MTCMLTSEHLKNDKKSTYLQKSTQFLTFLSKLGKLYAKALLYYKAILHL